MKKHLSVIMLMARSSIYKVAALLITMAAVETGLFWYTLQQTEAGGSLHLEWAVTESGIGLIFGAAFLLLTYMICRTGSKNGSQPGYTLQRLSISEKTVWIWQSVYNLTCYLLLWAAQILISMVLSRIYLSQTPVTLIGEQTVFLAYYRNDFLHCIMPLDDIWIWIRNGILAAAMAMAAAQYPFRQRRGKAARLVIPMSCGMVAFFSRSLGEIVSDVFGITMALIAIGVAVYNVFGGETDEEA